MPKAAFARLNARRLLALFLALVLAACTSGGVGSPTPIAVDASRTAGLVSSYRAANGLGVVGVDSALMQAAAAQALAMGRRDRMSHNLGGALPSRIARAGYDWGAAAENLGAGYASLDAAIDGWKGSAGHRRNLLNANVTEIGIAAVALPAGARHRTYWALILAAPRQERPLSGPVAAVPVP